MSHLTFSAEIPDDCRVITPCVRSVSVASPQQESSVPRVHSRVLMTWGFNSTTFTADPITTCVQWSININRNTSHIGDVKSGYLFGVGVALRPLTSKEQVSRHKNASGNMIMVAKKLEEGGRQMWNQLDLFLGNEMNIHLIFVFFV